MQTGFLILTAFWDLGASKEGSGHVEAWSKKEEMYTSCGMVVLPLPVSLLSMGQMMCSSWLAKLAREQGKRATGAGTKNLGS